MKRAFVIALAIHLCLLLGAGYIYVLPPEKREKLFEMVKIKAPPKPAARKVRISPPKKIRKPVPMRPVRRRTAKPIQLIAAKTDIVPEFTISLPEPSQAVYTPEVALVRLPEPVVAEAGRGFWGKDIEVKEKEIELESFGLQNLQPVGTVENPVTQIIFQFERSEAFVYEVYLISLVYPEQRRIIEVQGPVSGEPIALGPYAVPPESFVFSVSGNFGPGDASAHRPATHLSIDSQWCKIVKLAPNVIQYGFDDDLWPGEELYRDIVFTVTFLGAQGP